MNVTELTRRLALVYEKQDEVEKEYKKRKAAFDAENAGLTTMLANLKVAAEEDEKAISEAILDRFNESGERPEYPLGLQVRSVVVINDVKALQAWAYDNAPALLTLNEKFAKEYVTANGNVTNADGELIAGVVQKEIPQMGMKTLISWLNETRYNDNQEQETQDS